MVELILIPVLIIILSIIQSTLTERKLVKWILPAIFFIISTCLTCILVKSELTSYANKGKLFWEIFNFDEILAYIMLFMIFNIPTIIFLIINLRMKIFKSINVIITVLNAIYFAAINIIYFELPVPNRYYLRDLEGEILRPNSFLNISIIGFSISILLWLIYLIAFKKNKNDRRLSLFTILIEVTISVWGILYQVL